jgi:hypothetical protein
MTFFTRTISLYTLIACACTSSADPNESKEVGGGQSGTDSSGDQAGQCRTHTDEAAVDVDETIDTLNTSARTLTTALSGPFVLPCVGGDEFECSSAGELEISLELDGGATVQDGKLVFTEGGETTETDEACSVLRIEVDAKLTTTEGTLDVTLTELAANRRNAALIWHDVDGTLFGENEKLEVYIAFAMTGDSVRSIDAVIDNDHGGHALFSFKADDSTSGSGGAGLGDMPVDGVGVEHGGAGGAEQPTDGTGVENGGAGGS